MKELPGFEYRYLEPRDSKKTISKDKSYYIVRNLPRIRIRIDHQKVEIN